uniref:Uncharacterized protein n=1 Tax=Quercus lobata TaxID=97700 RepID=A0A7N2QYE7_QUELO
MQRAIASHGAFAVLYGRHSKHYIKKPEVLLGRATEDIIVDIDLGREGRANKISRRQVSFSVVTLFSYSNGIFALIFLSLTVKVLILLIFSALDLFLWLYIVFIPRVV